MAKYCHNFEDLCCYIFVWKNVMEVSWSIDSHTWRPYDTNDDEGNQLKDGENDLGKLRGDTIWQRTVQDRLTWRWYAEAAYAQPQDNTAAL